MSSIHILRFPDEIMERIFYHCVYDRTLFSHGIDNEDVTRRGTRFSEGHSWFATETVMVNRRFLRVGLYVLWRFVVVRSMASLEKLVARASGRSDLFPGDAIGRATWRLQLRICGSYDPSVVATILSFMPNTKVFVMFNTPLPDSSPEPVEQRPIAQALANLRDIVRIQFDSPAQFPTVFQVSDILQRNPQVKAIRLKNLQPLPPAEDREERLTRFIPCSRSLRTISMGFGLGDRRDRAVYRAHSAFIELMAVGPSSMFPHLANAYFLEYVPSIKDFLRVYGSQLRHLVYCTPARPETKAPSTNFLNQCPNLRGLVWVVTNWASVDEAHDYPPQHQQLRMIAIVYPELNSSSSPTHVRIQRVLERFEGGRYPSLRRVLLKERGGVGNEHGRTTWFRARRRALSKEGITLEVLAQSSGSVEGSGIPTSDH